MFCFIIKNQFFMPPKNSLNFGVFMKNRIIFQNILVNLKIITGNLKAASPTTKKLFKDPDLNKFYNNMLNELVERSGSLDSYLKNIR